MLHFTDTNELDVVGPATHEAARPSLNLGSPPEIPQPDISGSASMGHVDGAGLASDALANLLPAPPSHTDTPFRPVPIDILSSEEALTSEAAYRTSPQLSGNLQVDPEIHLPSPGMDVDVAYYYNSNTPYNGPFGYGRTINLNLQAQASGTPLIVSLTRGNGAVVSYQYDSGTSQYVPQTRTLLNTLEEDTVNNLWKETTPLGVVTAYPRNTTGQITSVTYAADATGNRHTFSYTSGRLSGLQDAVGRKVTFAYNGSNLLETVQDWAGRLTTFQYDTTSVSGKPALTTVIGPSGCQTGYGYETSGGAPRLNRITDPNGYATTYAYDGNNRIKQRTVSGVGTTFYTYRDRQTTVEDAEGGITISSVDEYWGLQSVFNGQNTEWTYTRNARGRETSRRDALGAITTTSYDSSGIYPVGIVDPIGRRTTIQYDAYHNPTTFTFADGTSAVSVYGYPGSPFDATGAKKRLQVQIDPLGNRTSLVYNGRGQLSSIQNALGQLTSYGYDALGNQIETIDPLGAVTTRVYDVAGNVTAIVDPLGRRTTTAYDAQNRMVALTDPMGSITSFGYDSTGNKTVQIDALGNRTTTTYNVFDSPTQTIDALGGITTRTYDKAGRPVTYKDAVGAVTRISYDRVGRPTAITEPLGLEYRRIVDYDATGRITMAQDELMRQTNFVYDLAGQHIATVDALGGRTSVAYDGLNRPQAITNALGYVATNVYDAAGRLTAQISPLGYATSYAYDALGRPTAMQDARGNRTSLVYTAAGHVQEIRRPLGVVTTYLYNLAGERIAGVDALGFISTLAYDARGSLQMKVDPLGSATTLLYDALARPTALIDANGLRTTAAYDALGRTTGWRSALGYRTTVVYDAIGRQRAVVDAKGQATTNLYDANSRLTATQDALGRWTTFSYGKNGALATRLDARGQLTSYSYDALDRNTRVLYNNGDRVLTAYDALGRPTKVTDTVGQSLTAYDADNRPVTNVDGWGRAVSYSYDAAGNRTALRDPDGGMTQYLHDAQNRLSKISNPFAEVTTFIYDALDREAGKMLSNGTRVSHTYDASGRETALHHRNGAGASIAAFTTTYDRAGNRLNVAETVAQPVGAPQAALTTYSYDAEYQLAKEARSGSEPHTTTYTYDAAGNRTLQNASGVLTTYVYDSGNQLLTAATGALATTYSYDANGNRALVNAAGALSTYTWNGENRLTRLALPGGIEEKFLYGADGLRRRKENADGVFNIVWDGPNILQEANGQNETLAQYTGFPDDWGHLVSQWRTSATTLPVARWEDQSGASNDATQSDPGKQPTWVADVLNGQPVVRFSGAQELSLPAIPQAAPSEIYFVYKPAAAGAGLFDSAVFNEVVFNKVPFNSGGNSGSGDGSLLGSANGSAPQILSGVSGAEDQPSVRWGSSYSHDIPLTDWHIVRFRLGTSDIGIAVDGASEQTFSHGASTLDVWNRLCRSSLEQFSGDIAEVLIYNVTLTSGQRGKIERYLTQKYDLDTVAPLSTDQILWLKADAGVTKDGSDRVSQWVDQSSVGSLATQATGSRQPLWVEDAINGQPALRFDGTDTFSVNAYGPGGTGITIFVVASGQEYQNLVCYWQSGEYVMYPWKSIHDGDYTFVQASDGGTNGVATGFLKDQWNLGVTKWHAGQVNGMAAWRNGQLVAQRDAYNTTMPTVPLWIGSRQMEEGFQGDVAEILVYDAGLSDADRISVQEYLALKYGLPGAFDPSSIAGLQLWLKADAGIGDSSYYSFDERGNTRALVSPSSTVLDSYLYDAYGQQLTASGSTANTFRYGGAYGYVFDGLDQMDVRMRGYDPIAGRWLSRDRWGFHGGIYLYLYSYNDPINLIDPIGAGPIKIDLTPQPRGDERNPYPLSGVPAGEAGWEQSAWGTLQYKDRRNEPLPQSPGKAFIRQAVNWLNDNIFSNPNMLPADVQHSQQTRSADLPHYYAGGASYNTNLGYGVAGQIVINGRNGNLYGGLGMGLGSPGFGYTTNCGYIDYYEGNPKLIDEFLNGHSVSYTAGLDLNITRTYANTSKGLTGATEFGFSNPQYGVSQVHTFPWWIWDRKTK